MLLSIIPFKLDGGEHTLSLSLKYMNLELEGTFDRMCTT